MKKRNETGNMEHHWNSSAAPGRMLTWLPDGERLRSITVHRQLPTFLSQHTQIHGFTFTFESGEKQTYGKAGRLSQSDVLELAAGEYLIRVAGRCDASRPMPGAADSKLGTLISVTRTTSRYRELTAGYATTFREEKIFSFHASASAQIIGIAVATDAQLPPIPVGLVECLRPVVGVRHGDPRLCRRVKRSNDETALPVVFGTVISGSDASHATGTSSLAEEQDHL